MSPGRRARRPPSSSCRLSGMGKARPAAGPGCLSEQARARARARRTGCPPWPPGRGRAPRFVRSRPSRSSSNRCTAPRDSGPTETRSSRPSRTQRSSSNGLLELGAFRRVANRPMGSSRRRRRAIWMAPAEAGSSHCTSSRATSRPSLDQDAQHVEHGEPDCVRIGRLVARLDQQERNLERPPARRDERGHRLV